MFLLCKAQASTITEYYTAIVFAVVAAVILLVASIAARFSLDQANAMNAENHTRRLRRLSAMLPSLR